VLSSITPAFAYPWQPGIHPVDEIRLLNKWLHDFCATNGYTYLDYYSSMSDANGAMLPGISFDGVHPTEKGYAIMTPLAEDAIAQALHK
jgi:lysophospholipase L1-like esterase